MIVIFIRKTNFYPIELPVEQCTFEGLAAHARANKGTLRVEDTQGKCLWRPEEIERRMMDRNQ